MDVVVLRKRFLSAYIVFCLVTAGLGGFVLLEDELGGGLTAEGAVITVDWAGGGNYTTIQAAIDNATGGDTIYVWAGNYSEHITINKPVTIIGNGSINTTINGSYSGDVVRITSSNVVFSGFYVTASGTSMSPGPDAGIKLDSVTNVTVQQTVCKYNRLGIGLVSSSSNTIHFNVVERNWHGIYLTGSSSNTILNNSCDKNTFGYESNGHGITMYSSPQNNVVNNTARKNSHEGMYLSNSPSTLSYNNCSENPKNGIVFYGTGVSIHNNTFHSNGVYGIDIGNSFQADVRDNELHNCGINARGTLGAYASWTAMYSHDVDTSNTVNGKPVRYLKNATGISVSPGAGQVILANCSNVVVQNQNCSNASIGIMLGYCNYLTIRNNTCNYNRIQGIALKGTRNTTVNNNTCEYNNQGASTGVSYEYGGIYLDGDISNDIISNNTCNHNRHGIAAGRWYQFEYAHDITLINNTCNNNDIDGILIHSVQRPVIKNNTCSQNIWDGIYADASLLNYNGIFFGNICDQNLVSGINISTYNYSAVENNTCLKSGDAGIHIVAMYYTQLSNNTINGSGVTGIEAYLSNNNVLFNNNFINNTLHAWDNGNNIWNLTSPTGGNYWDNWTTPDNNTDGFVDIPYVIPGGTNKDNLPLTNMSGNWSGGGGGQGNYSVIYIRPNGTVEPAGAPLSVSGSTYSFTGNITNRSIAIQRGNITLDGLGYDLVGVGNASGVKLTGLTNVTVTDINVSYFGAGVSVDSCTDIEVDNITCIENTSMGTGLGASYSSGVAFRNNTIKHIQWYGISLYTCNNSIIENNICSYNHYRGIQLEFTSNTTVRDNTCNYNDYKGINSRWSPISEGYVGNIIANNTCDWNGVQGIVIRSSYNNSVVDNHCSNNPRGIYISGFVDLIDNNTCVNNTFGIYSSCGSNMTVTSNNCTGNDYGMQVWSGGGGTTIQAFSGNLLAYNGVGMNVTNTGNMVAYHNDFIGNTLHAIDTGTNTWNLSSPTGGNYWDNWTTPDSNADGFVDNPYVLPGNGIQDNLPLTNMSGNWSYGGGNGTPPTGNFSVTSVTFLKNTTQTDQAYSRLQSYILRVKIQNPKGIGNTSSLDVTIDPAGANVSLRWVRATNTFSELWDPADLVTLEASSMTVNDSDKNLTVDFHLTFNWTYPHENLNTVSAKAVNSTSNTTWKNVTGLFRVENDLTFTGTLSVSDGVTPITSGSWVLMNTTLNWTGLKVVYQGTTNVYPPDGEFDVTVRDDDDGSWTDTASSGQQFQVITMADPAPDPSDWHTVNITGIPAASDASSVTFEVKVGNMSIGFSNATPSSSQWQTNQQVTCNITCNNPGPGVLATSVQFRLYKAGSGAWGGWVPAMTNTSGVSVPASAVVSLPDGENNSIQWRASLVGGVGPFMSPAYDVAVDTLPVQYSNPGPSPTAVSNSATVNCHIDITDATSGTNNNTVYYSVKKSGESTWSSWTLAYVTEYQGKILVEAEVTFNEGNDNYIKWRAWDIAGNGPTDSSPNQVRVSLFPLAWSNPSPWAQWSPVSTFLCYITITEPGPSMVDADSIEYRTSTDNGTTWSSWTDAKQSGDSKVKNAMVQVTFPDGKDNLMQWRGWDTAGNGPDASPGYPVWVDTSGLFFADAMPNGTIVKNKNFILCSVNVSDGQSGVYGPSINYSVKVHGQSTWSSWKSAGVTTSGPKVLAQVVVKLKPGDNNYIRWRASDLAGNAPVTSPDYQVRVDISNVTFKKFNPSHKQWQKSGSPWCNISFEDEGGAGVAGGSIQYRTSVDDGRTWTDWQDASVSTNGHVVNASVQVAFPDGVANLIQWQVMDMAGNGPVFSEPYRIIVDTTPPGLSGEYYDVDEEDGTVTAGVTVTDETSGVNASAVGYSVSTDGGDSWGVWTTVMGLDDGEEVEVEVVLEMPEGDVIMLMWQAWDLAGNGPVGSAVVDLGPGSDSGRPEVALLAPADGSVITDDGTELSWEPLGSGTGWTYEVYFGEARVPGLLAEGLTGTAFAVDGLDDGAVYHWTVVAVSGTGLRGVYGEVVWSFSADLPDDGVVTEEDLGFGLDPLGDVSLETGSYLTHYTVVRNTGTLRAVLGISLEAPGLEGGIHLGVPEEIVLEPGESLEMPVNINLPAGVMPGDYTVALTVRSLTAEELGFDLEATERFTVTVTERPKDVRKDQDTGEGGLIPSMGPEQEKVFIVGVIAGIIVLTTAPWWYIGLLFLFAPLMVRLRKKEEDRKWRDRIYGGIISKPGVHFTALKGWLEIANGTLIYNLELLIQEGRVRAERDGFFKRYYPVETPLHRKPVPLMNMEDKIALVVRDHPGAAQSEIAHLLDESRQAVHYHIRKMEGKGVIVQLKNEAGHTSIYLAEDVAADARRPAAPGPAQVPSPAPAPTPGPAPSPHPSSTAPTPRPVMSPVPAEGQPTPRPVRANGQPRQKGEAAAGEEGQ